MTTKTSNEYLTVCDTCGRKTWYETEQPCHCSYLKTETCGHCGQTKEFDEMVPCPGTLRKIDNSKLDGRFTYAYNNNLRVEVTWKKGWEDWTGYGNRTEGRKARFLVGKSTGWTPIYLMILQRNSHGGAAICSKGIESIRTL